MISVRSSDNAPEELGRCPTAQPVALVRALLVVEAHEGFQGLLHRRAAGEVAASELDAPVFLQDGAVQALDEAVGPGMTRLGAGVPDPQVLAGDLEGGLELRAAIGEHA